MKSPTTIEVDYSEATKHSMRNKVEEAVQFFIQGDPGCIMTIFPQALNPFMKSLESMGAWKKAVVLPYQDNRNKPIYVILKKEEDTLVSSLYVEGGVN
jgi:hypothetical protein